MSDGDIAVRDAVVGDAPCIAVLGTQVFLDTYAPDGIRPSLAREVLEQWSVEAIAATLGRPATRAVVAEANGHLVGFALLDTGCASEAVAAERPWKLDRLYVQRPFAARGIGTLLLKRAEAVAVAAGADVLWLTTWVHNRIARDFYARRGYVDVGRWQYMFEDERHENRIFARRLAPMPMP